LMYKLRNSIHSNNYLETERIGTRLLTNQMKNLNAMKVQFSKSQSSKSEQSKSTELESDTEDNQVNDNERIRLRKKNKSIYEKRILDVSTLEKDLQKNLIDLDSLIKGASDTKTSKTATTSTTTVAESSSHLRDLIAFGATLHLYPYHSIYSNSRTSNGTSEQVPLYYQLLDQASKYLALEDAVQSRDAEQIANVVCYKDRPKETASTASTASSATQSITRVKLPGTIAIESMFRYIFASILPKILEESIHHGSISHALSQHKQLQQNQQANAMKETEEEEEEDQEYSRTTLFDSNFIISENDNDGVLHHRSTADTVRHCERIIYCNNNNNNSNSNNNSNYNMSIPTTFHSILTVTKSMLKIRNAVKRALPQTPETLVNTSSSPRSPRSPILSRSPNLSRSPRSPSSPLQNNTKRYNLTFATSERKALYRIAEQSIDSARNILKNGGVNRKIRAFVQAEIRAANEIVTIGSCISSLSNVLLARGNRKDKIGKDKFKSMTAPERPFSTTTSTTSTSSTINSTTKQVQKGWMLKSRLNDISETLKQKKVSDIFLTNLMYASEILLKVRECVEQSEITAASMNYDSLFQSQTTLTKSSKPRRSSIAMETDEFNNDIQLKKISTVFYQKMQRSKNQLILYLCSPEIDEALSNARARELVTSSVVALRQAARDVRARGTSDAIVALASAVERGKRHGLDLHSSPRVQAYFARDNRLLVEVTSVLNVLRNGIQQSSQKKMKDGIERAERIGLSDTCVEVQTAKSLIMR